MSRTNILLSVLISVCCRVGLAGENAKTEGVDSRLRVIVTTDGEVDVPKDASSGETLHFICTGFGLGKPAADSLCESGCHGCQRIVEMPLY